MGYDRALKAICLEKTDRIPCAELVSNPDFERHITRIDPYHHPLKARLKFIETLDLDLTWGLFTGSSSVSNKPIGRLFTRGESSIKDEAGDRVVRWGAGTTRRWNWGEGFTDIEQVLEYDPLAPGKAKSTFWPSVDLSWTVEELAEQYNDLWHREQDLLGRSSLVMGRFYRTLFMWPLMTFGWRMFMRAVLYEPRRFEKLLDKFAVISEKVFKAWSLTDIRLMYTHDDLCTRQGPVFSPEWYRKHIFPWYRRFWAPLKKKGIKVLFVGDGNMDMLIDDVFEAGADGIWFEPYTNLEKVLKKYGDKKFVIGNMDARVLMFGGKKEIYEMVRRCTELGKDCSGYFYCVSTHIPHNVPVENIVTYFRACRELGKRQ